MGLQLIASKVFGSKPAFGGEDNEEGGGSVDAKAEAAEILGLDKTKAKALEVFIRACKGSAYEEEEE